MVGTRVFAFREGNGREAGDDGVRRKMYQQRWIIGVLMACMLLQTGCGMTSSQTASGAAERTGAAERQSDASANWKVGQKIDGFTLTDVGQMQSVSAQKLVFQHDTTGATLVFLQNDDPNRSFMSMFATAPTDDTGKQHILEHVLCMASQNYPGQDVFMKASANCYNTYMNAFTNDGETGYIASSMDEDQLAVLVDYYMDCAFHPAFLTNEDYFKSEGIRYELTDPDAELTSAGVVYNEMQGVFGSIDNAAQYNKQKILFRDTKERFLTGGVPQEIDKLTYQDFLDYYKQAYVPNNCTVLFYGDNDVERFLKVFHDKYFAGFDATASTAGTVEEQQPFDQPVKAVCDFPASADAADTTGIIEYTVALPEDYSFTKIKALELLADYLGDSSQPLMQALYDSGIGSDYAVDYDYYGSQMTLAFRAYGVEDASQADQFRQTVLDGVKQCTDQGLDQELIDGIYHQAAAEEEMLRNNQNVGEMLSLRLLMGIDNNRLACLDPSDAQKKAMQLLQDGKGPELLKEAVSDNKLAALVVTMPKKGLLEQQEAAQKKTLADRESAMSESERAALVTATKEFKTWSTSGVPDTTMKKLEVLDAQNLKMKIPSARITQTSQNGLTVMTADVADSELYQCLLEIDLSKLTPEELLAVRTLSYMTGGATTKHSAEEIAKLDGKYLTDSYYSVSETTVGQKAIPTLDIGFYASKEDMDQAVQLALEKIADLDLQNPDNQTQLQMLADSSVQNFADPDAMWRQVMAPESMAHQTSASALAAYLSGTQKQNYMETLQSRFQAQDTGVYQEYQDSLQHAFSGGRVYLLCVGAPDGMDSVTAAAGKQLQQVITPSDAQELTDYQIPDTLQETKVQKSGQTALLGMAVDTTASYVSLYCDTALLPEKNSGADELAAKVLTSQLLTPRFRYQLSAYGADAVYLRHACIGISLYRAPSFDEYVTELQQIPQVLSSLKLTEEELNNYKLATISAELNSSGNLQDAMDQMTDQLAGYSADDRAEQIAKIQKVSVEDIRAAAADWETMLNSGTCIVLASGNDLKNSKCHFDQIINLQ